MTGSYLPPLPKAERELFFSSKCQGEFILLEGLLAESSPERGAVIAHPHPLYGGDMYNKVVETAVRAVFSLGITTLRFNFRGVGRSGGVHSGREEVWDLVGALSFLRSEYPSMKEFFLVGYSFGSFMTAGLLSRLEEFRRELEGVSLRGAFLIAPPLEVVEFPEFSVPSGCSLGMICGDGDQFCSSESFLKLCRKFPESHCLLVEGADHFFHGKLSEIVRAIRDTFSSVGP